MEKKIVQSYKLQPGGLLNKEQKIHIDKFLQFFKKNFEIDWNKDLSFTLSVTNTEIGQVLKITVKDTDFQIVDIDQEVIPFMENVNKNTGEVYEIELIKTGHLNK